MSIENQIAALTAAVIELTNALKGNATAPAAPAPNVNNAAIPAAPVTVTVTQPVAAQPAPVVASLSNMPAPPSFVAAPAAPAPTGAPFSDGKGLIDYVMSSYKALGATKGAQIQGVLTSMGYQNINDVKPEHYGHLFAGIEGLKS